MTKREFLDTLYSQLAFELPERIVSKNIQFYSDYIDGEVSKGRSVGDVLAELDDPSLIAKSIISAEKSGPDGIPGSSDDIDYSSEIYGNGTSSGNAGGTAGDTGSYGYGSGYGGNGASGDGTTGQGYGGTRQSAGNGYDSGKRGAGGNGGFKSFNLNGLSAGLLLVIIVGCVLLALLFIGALIGTITVALGPILIPLIIICYVIFYAGKKR